MEIEWADGLGLPDVAVAEEQAVDWPNGHLRHLDRQVLPTKDMNGLLGNEHAGLKWLVHPCPGD